MKVSKLSVYTLMANIFWLVDGRYNFLEYNNVQQEEIVGCKSVKQTIHDVMKEVKCMPRTTLMKLVLNNEYTYYPNVIPLKRCHGHCRHLTCLPIQTKMTPIALQRSHINSSTVSCVTVEVEEHTQCKCACEVMSYHCNSNQRYVKRDCECKCINDKEKEECMNKSNMIWDPENCKCMCNKMEETCSSDLKWIREECACGKVMMYGNN